MSVVPWLFLVINTIVFIYSYYKLYKKYSFTYQKLIQNDLLLSDLQDDLYLEKKLQNDYANKVKDLEYKLILLERDKEQILLEKEAELRKQSKQVREDSLKRMRSSVYGQIMENFAPFTLKSYHLKDYCYLGNPIDFIIFSGMTDVNSGEDAEIAEIILLEVKTGNAKLKRIQRKIRDAVVAGRVSFVLYNMETDQVKQWAAPLREEDADE